MDYADGLAIEREFDRPRDKRSAIYKQLVSLAQRLSVPVWTGGHVNHAGDDGPPPFAHRAESLDTARVGDHALLLLPAFEGTDECSELTLMQVRHKLGVRIPAIVDFSRPRVTGNREVA